MSITDELRKWAEDNTLRDMMLTTYPPQHAVHGVLETLLRIADRIDAEHEAMLADVRKTVYQGLIELPKDADGEYINVGDVMEFSAFEIEKPVTRMVDGIGQGVFFAWCGERGYQQHEAKRYRHHHAPTVEDVLREFADRVCSIGHQWGLDAADTIAEYAKRLKLAEGEDA